MKNYVSPKDLKNIEDFSTLLINLNLIFQKSDTVYNFREIKISEIAPEIILFALLSLGEEDKTISIDELQKVSLIFGLSMASLIEIIHSLILSYPDTLVFSDNSGIKNVQFLKDLNKFEVLDHYYGDI